MLNYMYMHSTLGNRTTLALDDLDDYTEQVELWKLK